MKQLNSALVTLAVTAALGTISPAAKAVTLDPSFVETVTNTCPAGCASVTLAADPLSGITTVVYTFNSTIPQVVAGDVKITEFGGSTVGDLIRFENTSSTTAVAFIFSSDIATGLAADVGLPASFQSNTVTIAENSSGFAGPYTPTSSQPGFCLTSAGAACSSGVTYGLTSPDPVPIPAVGAGLPLIIGAGGLLGWWRRRKAAA